MSFLIHPFRKGLAGAQDMLDLRTVLIYQNLDAGLLAKCFCNSLERDLGVICQLNDRVWRFDVLAIPEVRNAAASAAAKADLVIISNADCTELPGKVEEWLEMWMWLIDQTNPALLALFGSPRNESEPVRKKLQRITHNNGIDFFSTMIPQETRNEELRSTRKNAAPLRSATHYGPFG